MDRKEIKKRQPARSFEDLFVWKKAHKFVVSVYQATHSFPKTELYGLISQMRRAAVSVPANIAEGFKKKTKADKVNYLNIAYGSLEESRYYLILSEDLGYCNAASLKSLAEEVSKLLSMYRSKIENA